MSAPKKTTAIVTEESKELSFFDESLIMPANEFQPDELAVPRLVILQDGSPQVKKREAEYIDDAEPGMFCDTVLARTWSGDTGLVVLPCCHRSSYVEWVIREEQGGFVADLTEQPGVAQQYQALPIDDKHRRRLPNGHELRFAVDHYILAQTDPGEWREIVLTLSSTQLGKSRKWNTMILSRRVRTPDGQMVPAVPYAFPYHLTTVAESNVKGSWYGIKVTGFEAPKSTMELFGRPVVDQAKRFRASVMEGRRRANAGEAPTTVDDEIPF